MRAALVIMPCGSIFTSNSSADRQNNRPTNNLTVAQRHLHVSLNPNLAALRHTVLRCMIVSTKHDLSENTLALRTMRHNDGHA